MRPLELTLDGFRSYRRATTFDFRGRRLIGVVGPIGAGKSSMLDAIAYALYAKTPTVERDTKSLIHQRGDQCKVRLVFEVEGEVWRVTRAMRRRGAGGHTLERLREDDPDAPVVESIQQERPIRARVEELLGLDFDGFCRSVLLAQNRFSEFLRATPGQRDKVLKGVFGYERFDAALQGAKERVAAAEAELSVLDIERQRLARASDDLAAARERQAEVTARHDALAAAAPAAEALAERHRVAVATAEATVGRIEEARSVDETLGSLGDVDALVGSAADADAAVAAAATTLGAATQERKEFEATRDAVAASGSTALADFAALVERHDLEVRQLQAAEAQRDLAAAALVEAEVAMTEARDLTAASADAHRATTERAEAASREARVADEALHAATHSEMAAALRRSLVAGDHCPVCDQPVRTLPAPAGAPTVDAARAALERAKAETQAAAAAEREAAAAASAARERERSAEADRARCATAAETAEEQAVGARAALDATSSELVDRLGEGDPHALLARRRAEVEAAESAVREAIDREALAREALEDARSSAETAAARLAQTAIALTGAWGRLGETTTVEPSPDAVATASAAIRATVRERLAELEGVARQATEELEAIETDRVTLLTSLGLPAETELATELAGAAADRAAADQRVSDLTHTLEEGADLTERVVDAEGRRDLAGRLAADLQPSRFLAYLLEEERVALAELGSVHFLDLSGGAYRFTDDDAFDVEDLNAGGAVRHADSLSGGETFLASLALALALAEMVARGGGRLDAFFLDEGFGSLDPEHLDRAMDGIGRLVAGDGRRLVVLVSHVAEMREALEDLVILDKDGVTGDTIVVAGASPAV
jgi:exonuclease SbcC